MSEEEYLEINIRLRVKDNHLFFGSDASFFEVEGRVRNLVLKEVLEEWPNITEQIRKKIAECAETYRQAH